MKAKAMKDISVAEAEADVADEVEAVVVDEVGVLIIATSTTMRKVKVLQEVVGEAIQTQGIINPKFNVHLPTCPLSHVTKSNFYFKKYLKKNA